ncbi:hypothetical protein BGZ49_003325, partial [Haplosporangium sp. Z 27]
PVLAQDGLSLQPTIDPALDSPTADPSLAEASAPELTVDPDAPTVTVTADIQLPTIMYIPPYSPDMNATDPFFPPGSESCQRCKYFYPKLKQCNQVANTTLARLPRFSGNDKIPATSTTTAVPVAAGATTFAPAEFTTILPFLQCICPDQGLPAIRVCMTCFRISNQRNFLDVIQAQDVSTALASFQEACVDSDNGVHVPPPSKKGQSASTQNSNHAGMRPEIHSIHFTMGLGLLLSGVMTFLGGCSTF